MSKRVKAILLVSLLTVATARAIEQTIPVPATLNRQAVGDLAASVEDDQLRALGIAPIRGTLRDLLAPERFSQLPTNNAPVPVTLLRAAGIQTRFDFQNLTVDLVIPAEFKREQVVNLVGTPNVRAVNATPPAGFSAYMNVRGGLDYVESSDVNSTGFSKPQVAFENAFNFSGLVLENETAINPAPDKAWEKRDTRLIFDDPAHRIRYTAGDLNYPVAGLQGFIPMLGLSIARENSLQRYRVISPLGQSSFFLKQDSKVEVILNGNVVQTLQLAAGPQQIRNFPLTGGANNVVLRITDPVGRVEYINATLFYDPGLLKAGESEFSYAAGFPGITDPQSPFYQYDAHPAGSVFHRWGLTDRLTLGANAQATEDTQQAGAEAVFSALGGTVNINLAGTRDRWLDYGHAEQLQYHYYPSREGALADSVFSVSAMHQSSAYTPPVALSTSVAHPDLWDFQARYSQRLSDHWSAGVGYTHQLADDNTQLRTCNLIAGYHDRRVSVDVSLNHNAGSASREEWTAFLNFRISFEPGHTVFASYDSDTHSSRAEWHYTPPNNIESVGVTLGVQHADAQSDFYGDVQYWGRRAELVLSQNSLTTGENSTSLRWGTALVYAEGQFAVSRPIQDSFAIVRSSGALREDGGVGVQPQGGVYQAREDFLGPAVVPQISSYYPLHLTIEPLSPEAEFDSQQGDFLLSPTYRSGTVIHVGRPAMVDATATLLWPDGQPAALQVWTVTAPDGTTSECVSDRAGIAYFGGLSPGTYQAMISDYPETTFTFTIPATKARLIQLGEIKLPAKP